MISTHVRLAKNYAGPRGTWPSGIAHEVGGGGVPADVAKELVARGWACWCEQVGEGKNRRFVDVDNPIRSQ